MTESQNSSSTRLPFPPVTRSHILHCSYHHWHPKYVYSGYVVKHQILRDARYRSITPKARLIPLTAPFLAYLRSDGIILPPDPSSSTIDLSSTDTDSGIFSSTSTPNTSDAEDSDAEDADPSTQWPEIHAKITFIIHELGGNIIPKLNWSAPKDATWINATNSMECISANDVYLLLKSSDFVTHDLEQVFDDCVPLSPSPNNDDGDNAEAKEAEIPYHLILRKTIPALVPSLEFRCFVRKRTLLCITQRDLNHYDFLPNLVPTLRPLIERFFTENLKTTFEDEDFVFDVYIPPPHRRVWLMDINPWAPRTDPLLFSWMEILEMAPPSVPGLYSSGSSRLASISQRGGSDDVDEAEGSESDGLDEEDEVEEDIFTPEFRLVNRDDPEAYAFNTPRYSAHKMPKDVVDAGGGGEAGLREFMGRWREVVREQEREDEV
ncbi:MAG: hypothetical protein Q9186_006899 [Xanthomendoza sp. 1 TL-2023]